MEFGILGPIEIIDSDGRHLSIPRRVRTLLAALLLRPNQVVAAGDLIDTLWDTTPPDNPRSALQTVVYRLRTALGNDHTILRSMSAGYRLTVGPDELDLLRFRSYVERAATHPQPAGRIELLTTGLGLWRGRPLTGIPDGSLVRDNLPRLVEERLHATELLLGCRLDTGQHAGVVADLTELTERHPDRERFWALLIRALYRSGRQADALAAYQQVRCHLRDYLGVDPGAELQDLHAAVLRGDPELHRSGPALTRDADSSSGVLASAPRQLPADIARFCGRDRELRTLDALVPDGPADARHIVIAAVGGSAGIGKTALALHWAHRVAQRFPDGQLYLNLRGYGPGEPMDPAIAAETLLRSLGLPANRIPSGAEARSAVLRTVLADKRMLVLLDNARDADQVRPLLPGSGSLVLVTSRSQLRGLAVREGAQRITLDQLDDTESAELVASILGPRADEDPAAVIELARLCRGLPLALAIAAERAIQEPATPLADLVRQLRDENARLDILDTGDSGSDLRGVFSWSYRALPADAAAMFRLIGIAAGTDLGAPAAAALAGISTSRAKLLLDQLVNVNQVVQKRHGRYEMHDLVRAYAAELAAEHDPPEQRIAAQRRLLDWLMGTAFNARPLLQPSETPVSARVAGAAAVTPLTFAGERAAQEWYETEHHNLIAAVHRAYELGDDDRCWRLAYATWIHLQIAGAWDDVLHIYRVGLRAVERAGDTGGKAYVLTGLGAAYRATGDSQRAVRTHREALALFRAEGDVTGEATALSNLGFACRHAGLYDEAMDNFRQALAIDRSRDEFGNEAISLYQLAITLTAVGRPADAVRYAAEAIEVLRRIGHRRGEARALQVLAAAHARLGPAEVAIVHFRSAAERYEELGDRWYQAAALTELGDTLYAAEQVTDSRATWRRALSVLEDLGAPDAEDLRAKLRREP